MYKIILFISAIIIFYSNSNSQISLNPEKFYKETLSLYQSGKWDKLIDTCNYAFDNFFDSYILRYQAGVAYYMKKNYLSAVNQFNKALEFEPDNFKVTEYLYYSYLFSGRNSDAEALILTMPDYLKNKLKIQNVKIVSDAYSESGYSFNNKYDDKKKNVFNGSAGIYDEQLINRDEFYYNLTLFHQLSRRVNIINSFNIINLRKLKQFNETVSGLKNFDLNTNQFEYYFNLSANVSVGLDVGASLHFLGVNSGDIKISYDTTITPNKPLYEQVQNKFNNILFLISVSKYIDKFKFTVTNSYSNLNNGTQYQNVIALKYFPLGNPDLYLSSDFILHSDRNEGGNILSEGIFEPKIGVKINRYLWLEGYSTFGNIYNYNESNGFVVYNNTDKIKNRFGINLISPVIQNKLALFFYYQYFNQESYYITYTNSTNYYIKNFINPNHKFIGGLKWTF